MIVLGIDPGGAKGLAWAMYDDKWDDLTVGMEKVRDGMDPSCSASRFVERCIRSHPVILVGIEVPHINRLPKSAMPEQREKLLGAIYAQGAASLKLAEVVGACKASAWGCQVAVVDLQPAQIKQAMTGKGNASKADVREAVRRTYEGRTTLIRGPRERRVLREDEADAAACAVAALRMAPKEPEGVLL